MHFNLHNPLWPYSNKKNRKFTFSILLLKNIRKLPLLTLIGRPWMKICPDWLVIGCPLDIEGVPQGRPVVRCPTREYDRATYREHVKFIHRMGRDFGKHPPSLFRNKLQQKIKFLKATYTGKDKTDNEQGL